MATLRKCLVIVRSLCGSLLGIQRANRWTAVPTATLWLANVKIFIVSQGL